MRKFIAAILCICLVLPSCAALAQSAGNLNNGGFIETDGEFLYVARPDGVFRMDLNGQNAARIAPDHASHLQMHGGRLYYLAGEYGEDEYGDLALRSQLPKSCLPDGTDPQVLGEARAVGQSIEYPAQEGGEMTCDTFVGYADFTVAGDAMYFFGNSGEAGSYVTGGRYTDETGAQVESSVTVRYSSGIALYRMALDGSGEEALTATLGNAVAHLAVLGDRIYAAAGYIDGIYAYDYVNYYILGLDGAPVLTFENSVEDDWPLFSEAGAFYHLPLAVLPSGDDLLVSLADSEGDFIASQLMRLSPDGLTERIAVEQGFLPSILAGETLYYVGSESQEVFYDDEFDYGASLGIYAKRLTEEGLGAKLAALPFDGYLYGFAMSVLGKYVYFAGSDDALYRVPIAGGGLERWTDAGFAASEIEFHPEEY